MKTEEMEKTGRLPSSFLISKTNAIRVLGKTVVLCNAFLTKLSSEDRFGKTLKSDVGKVVVFENLQQ